MRRKKEDEILREISFEAGNIRTTEYRTLISNLVQKGLIERDGDFYKLTRQGELAKKRGVKFIRKQKCSNANFQNLLWSGSGEMQ